MAKSAAKLKVAEALDDPTTGARQELAAALANVKRIEVQIAADEAAVSDASAEIRSRQLLLKEAQEREVPVLQRRVLAAEIATLEGEIQDWIEHRAGLGTRLDRREQNNLFAQREWAQTRVRDAVGAVVQHHPGTIALLEKHAETWKNLRDLAATIMCLSAAFGVPDEFATWDALPYYEPNADRAWLEAIERLANDPATPLPD